MTGRGPSFFRRAPSTDTQLDVRAASIEAIPWSAARSRGPDPDSTSKVGSRYEILNEIHRGGMGEILLARLTTPSGFSRQVVLKGLLSKLSADNISHALFMREAHLMSQLEHPNIVRVFDMPEIDGRPYLAMEFVRGRNLHQVIQRAAKDRTGIPPGVALTVVSEALRGLHSAHCLKSGGGEALGLVHRDVSPGNILLGFFGEIKVTDFGIAKLADSPKYTGPRSIRGKARYVAPEQVHGRPATVGSDLYSAGVVLAEALMGAPLWERGTVADTLMAIVTEDRSEVLDRILRDLPSVPGLRSVLRSALSTDPSQRPISALHFAETLEAIVRHGGHRPTTVELGLYLRDLFRGDDDVPLNDGFGHSGLPPPVLKRDRLDDDDTASATYVDMDGADATIGLPTAIGDVPAPASVPLAAPPPLSIAPEAVPTPLVAAADSIDTSEIAETAAVYDDPADPAPADLRGRPLDGSPGAREVKPTATAPVQPGGNGLPMLLVGICIGACIAITGCLLALNLS